MRAISAALLVCAGLACASTLSQPTAEVLGVGDVMGAKATYAGRRIAVEGRVYVQTLSGLHACEPGQACPKYDDALLTLMNPRAGKIPPEELLRLYRKNREGTPEQVHCRIVDENQPAFDCGTYLPDAVVVVQGTFTKEQVPDQTAVDAAGRVRVLSYRDVFYLVID